MRYVFILGALLVLSACAPAALPTLEERVPNASGEVLYVDLLSERIPADEASFFGVRLGDPLDRVVALHGPPQINRSYRFGQIQNYEYFLGQNRTVVLYHAERGVVTSILLEGAAAPLLVGETRLDLSLADVYGLLGVPDLALDRPPERVFFYDSLGYEIYIYKKAVDRVYFTAPDRGISGPGVRANASLNGSEAQDGAVAQNTPPVICVQVVTPAVGPDGSCAEYPSPCDVPEGSEHVEACP